MRLINAAFVVLLLSMTPVAPVVAGTLDILRQRAEQCDAEAQDHLGSSYSSGLYVEKNYAEALKWYRKAADDAF